MGSTKKGTTEKVSRRHEQILKYVSQAGGATGNHMAEALGVSRGTVLRDIADLRRKGYPIQVSSMVTENGMCVALYELPKYYQKR